MFVLTAQLFHVLKQVLQSLVGIAFGKLTVFEILRNEDSHASGHQHEN
jgi:hypothetical protein